MNLIPHFLVPHTELDHIGLDRRPLLLELLNRRPDNMNLSFHFFGQIQFFRPGDIRMSSSILHGRLSREAIESIIS